MYVCHDIEIDKRALKPAVHALYELRRHALPQLQSLKRHLPRLSLGPLVVV